MSTLTQIEPTMHIYQYRYDSTGWQKSWDMGAMNKAIHRLSPKPPVIWIDTFQYMNGPAGNAQFLSERRIKNITIDPEKLRIGVMIEFENGYCTVADGNHRIAKAYRDGVPRYPMFHIEERWAEEFAVAGDLGVMCPLAENERVPIMLSPRQLEDWKDELIDLIARGEADYTDGPNGRIYNLSNVATRELNRDPTLSQRKLSEPA